MKKIELERDETPPPMSSEPKVSSVINQLHLHLELYEACGNMLGIVPLSKATLPPDFNFQTNAEFRAFLAEWGKRINSDSVMVLQGDPKNFAQQGYHVMMYVFEPNGSDDSGMAGGISTMCGNGIRAVSDYIRVRVPETREAKIMTMSGLRTISWENGMYAVEMGSMTNRSSDLSRYIDLTKVPANKDGRFFHSPIPEEIRAELAPYTHARTWSIGLNGDYDERGNIDGEPHVIIEIPEGEAHTLDQLRELAVTAGPIITKKLSHFPKEINVNFIVYKGSSDGSKKLEILNCTHERNLGDDPDHSVTAACGTGSTVAGGITMLTHGNGRLPTISVLCTGGNMEISYDGSDGLIMKGPASKLNI